LLNEAAKVISRQARVRPWEIQHSLGVTTPCPEKRIDCVMDDAPRPYNPGDLRERTIQGNEMFERSTRPHHVEGGIHPAWVGTPRVRKFKFEDPDNLRLIGINDSKSSFPGTSELHWRRIR